MGSATVYMSNKGHEVDVTVSTGLDPWTADLVIGKDGHELGATLNREQTEFVILRLVERTYGFGTADVVESVLSTLEECGYAERDREHENETEEVVDVDPRVGWVRP